jgi:hypothetical protein
MHNTHVAKMSVYKGYQWAIYIATHEYGAVFTRLSCLRLNSTLPSTVQYLKAILNPNPPIALMSQNLGVLLLPLDWWH